jgi:hypothetical protein
METDELENLTVLDDPVALIRRRPDMDPPSHVPGPYWAARLVHDIAARASPPVGVSRDGPWWLVSAAGDWVKSPSSEATSLLPFHRIVSRPDWGLYAFRSEILLTAFADAVVTVADGRWTCIAGELDRSSVPSDLRRPMETAGPGRHVAVRPTTRPEDESE